MNYFSETGSASNLGSANIADFPSVVPNLLDIQSFRLFVATWNVGGKFPHDELKLNKFLPLNDQTDVYVLGFQEIVPMNAGNVLVIEDSEPAVKWLALINQALNRPLKADAASKAKTDNSLLLFQKPPLKAFSKILRAGQGKRLKACNCSTEVARKYYRNPCFRGPYACMCKENSSKDEEGASSKFMVTDSNAVTSSTTNQPRYCLVAAKQMVGIFLAIWVKKELVQHIGHFGVCRVGRGIIGCLGNKGCIAVRMTLQQTSFCFVCCHLSAGEKEGNELRRNSDVVEILKNAQFPNICKTPDTRIPKKILEHDRVIWLGDLNYRIAQSNSQTTKLVEEKNWNALFEKDQLRIEREAGRVFKGWLEGRIRFPPTYKYSMNSDSYSGERTPAWCDRILWHGGGFVHLFYGRGESKFSDHRPVYAVFMVDVV